MRINIDDTETDSDGSTLYEAKPYTGEVIETDRDGNLIYLNTYTMGWDDGPYREWYAGGGLKGEGRTRLGIPVGIWRAWHENGQLAEESVYDDEGSGKRLRRRVWAEDGTLTTDFTYQPPATS